MKQALRRAYIRIMPEVVRGALGRLPGIRQLRERWFHRDASLHDDYYTTDYYAFNETMGWAGTAAKALTPLRIGELSPREAVDLGCGTGEFVRALKDAGVAAHGVDFAQAAVARCVEAGLDVRRADLTRPGSVPWRGDLVLSFEVAEHLVPEAAPAFVENICGAARAHVVMTAAGPGQVGLHHFNCQPKSYWIALMLARGFRFDADLTLRWERVAADAGLALWFQQNLMVFHRAPAGSA